MTDESGGRQPETGKWRPDAFDAFVDLLGSYDAEVAETALTLRERVRQTHPEMTEKVYHGWRGLGFHHPEAGYVCAIFPRARSVYLSFEWGVRLPDPEGRLIGTGKMVRSLEYRPSDEIDGFEEYLQAAIDLA
jgi:hypothetical protein